MTTTMLIKVESHRHRSKVESALNRRPQCFFSWTRPGNWLEVTVEESVRLKELGIKAVQARDATDLRPCIDWS